MTMRGTVFFRLSLGSLLFIASLVVRFDAHAADAQRSLINGGAVRIMAGSYESTDFRLAVDLANALDDGYDLRIIPMVGKGSARNIEDLLYLTGVDITIVQSDVLDFYRRNDLIANIDGRLRYIAKLHDEEVHILASSELRSIEDLRGRTVNVGVEGSGTFMTSGIIFEDLGIEIEPATFPQRVALQKLRDGDIDALVFVDGAPIDLIQAIEPEESFRLIAIPSNQISGAYLPAQLTAEYYPELIKPYAPIETVAVGEVLAAYNWPSDHPRARPLDRFVDRFFGEFQRLLGPTFHPKWREVDLAEPLPDWQRVSPAESAIEQVATAINEYGEYLSFECVACHRVSAENGAIPVIAALPSEYFINALKGYRAGLRTHLVMQDVAQSLNDVQVEALAAYYAALREAKQ